MARYQLDAFGFRLGRNSCIILWLVAVNLLVRNVNAGDPTFPADKDVRLSFFASTVCVS